MLLAPKTRLGPYEILAPIGRGGMGEVYRAHDSRLNRDVAIKVSNTRFSERFTREARAIAALNHTNICHLYDVGPDYLVMEYVEGKNLQGPMDFDDALPLIQQLIDGIEAAHENNIVHRDLKPANIKVTREGVLKILDFGLAKAMESPAGDNSSPEDSPTYTLSATQPGVVLGTAAYMAPEQAKGKAADRRADIWSFGVIVYELLSGRRLFAGETTIEILGAVLNHTPDISAAPARVNKLLRWCLEKDRKQRLASISDARRLLGPDDKKADEPTSSQRLRWLTAALLAFIVAAAGLVGLRPARVSEAPAMSTLIAIPPEQQLVEGGTPIPFDVSPDGTKLVYLALQGGRRRLFLRPLAQFDAKPLLGTEDASSPFFSVDGRWVGFFAQRRLFKVATDGGSPVLMAEVESEDMGACWTEDDTIVYGSASGLMRIPAGGGKPSRLTTLGAGEDRHVLPRLIRGTTFVLFTVHRRLRQIGVVSLKDGKHRILMDGSQATYVSNKLVYATDDVLRAVPFDLADLRLSGNPVTLLDDVYTGLANSQTYFRLTSSGMLVYVPGRNEHSLVRVDRAGHSTPLTARRAGFRLPRLSRDANFVAVTIDPPDEGRSDVWILDLKRGAFSKFTREGHNLKPMFTPDGKRVAWDLWGAGPKPYWQAVDGSGQRERLSLMDRASLGDFTPDGKYAVLTAGGPSGVLWALPLGSDEKAFPLVESTYSTTKPRFSPDGRWLAYTSDESGRDEVYVRRFPRSERNWIVSTDGGTLPVWSRDGKEIFYLEGRRMMAVNVAAGTAFSAGKPVLLFDRPELTMAHPVFDVMGDGFLMVERDPLSMLTEFRVVQNWVSQSKQ